jgi:TonB family protein
MAHSPPSILGSDLPPNEGEVSVPQNGSAAPHSSNNPISLLRESLSTGSQSPASVLHATAETARVLAGADGVAIAVRTKGVVICRARSGDIAPDLGTQLSVDSGISGECLRTGTVLICQDAASDARVDPDVCRVLGIRSIAVVPLNGPSGIGGILEAFSERAGAFGDEQLDLLRGLAAVAEAAYEQECIVREESGGSFRSRLRGKPAVTPPAKELVAKETAEVENNSSGHIEAASFLHSKRFYWIVAAATAVLLLVSGVVWLSWRDPTPEVAASDTIPQPVRPVEKSTSVPPKSAPSKPEAGVVSRSTTSKTGDVLKNAAAIQRVGSDAHPASGTQVAPPLTSQASSAPSPQNAEAPPNEPPPTVEIAASTEPDLISGMGAGTGTMPALGARVSQGITQGALVHQVQPAYPSQAWAQRIAGSVVLDATIGANGSVRKLDLISGAPLLATAAKEAVRQWKYSPALLNGSPIEVQKRITVVFKLP